MGRLRRVALDPAAYYLLLGATLTLAVFGLVMVFSAGTGIGLARLRDGMFFARRQAVWLLVGLAFMYVASRLDYRRLDGLPSVAWWVSVILLVAVWVPGLGWTVNGATRWIRIGDFTIQPSEITKLVVIVCVAQAVSRIPASELSMRALAQPIWRWVVLPFCLVILQRDMGTAIIILVGALIVCVLAGMRLRDLAGVGLGVGALSALLIALEPYRLERIVAFINPWEDPQGGGYQAIQALYAFGSGGLAGVGLGAGRQKFLYLPAAHTDFILAVIGEELGLFGTLGVVACFAVFAFAGIRLALKVKDPFGRLLAGGLVGTVTLQATLNMFAVTGLAPVTGVPLPLLSFGGWALMTTLTGIGLVLAVGAPPRREAHREDRDQRRRDCRARVPGYRPRLRVVDSTRSA